VVANESDIQLRNDRDGEFDDVSGSNSKTFSEATSKVSYRSYPMIGNVSKEVFNKYREGLGSLRMMNGYHREIVIMATCTFAVSDSRKSISMSIVDPVIANANVHMDDEYMEVAVSNANNHTKHMSGSIGKKKSTAKIVSDISHTYGPSVKGRLALLAADFAHPASPRVSYVNFVKARIFFTTVSSNCVSHQHITGQTLSLIYAIYTSKRCRGTDAIFVGNGKFTMTHTCYGPTQSPPACRLILYPRLDDLCFSNTNLRITNFGVVQYSGEVNYIDYLFSSFSDLLKYCFTNYTKQMVETLDEPLETQAIRMHGTTSCLTKPCDWVPKECDLVPHVRFDSELGEVLESLDHLVTLQEDLRGLRSGIAVGILSRLSGSQGEQ